MILRRTIFSFLFLLVVKVIPGQEGLTIKASIDKNRILIGEPFQLSVEGYLPPGLAKTFFDIDSIPHFEFLEKPRIDTVNTGPGTRIQGVYTITSFDSGHWVIPSFVLSKALQTDTIPVDVVFSEFDPNQDYHDIKDIIEVAPPPKKRWRWILAGVALLLAGLTAYLLKKKKRAALPVPEPMMDPFEEAMKQLELLQKEKPPAKKYHSKLTGIFRLYVFRKKGILSLQKTTADLVVQLKDLNFSKEQFDNLSQVLRLSDFVKFAKYIPTSEDDRNCFDEIKSAIFNIEKSGVGRNYDL